jgi:hypothetical protein
MTYTAIYQDARGKLTYGHHSGQISRKDTWPAIEQVAGADGKCLIALVPGSHPVYFYENFVSDNEASELSEQQKHDPYEIIYQIT